MDLKSSKIDQKKSNPIGIIFAIFLIIALLLFVLFYSAFIPDVGMSALIMFSGVWSAILSMVACRILMRYINWKETLNNPQTLYDDVLLHGNFKSLEQLEQKAEKGNLEAAILLVKVYFYKNDILPNDLDKAYKWAKIAAEKGDGASQEILGDLYVSGEVVARDINKAASWYEKAVANYEYTAERGLAYCYFKGGNGLEQDLSKAFIHLKEAATKVGFDEDIFTVGYWLFTGQGVKQNKDEAFIWFKALAEKDTNEVRYDESMCMHFDYTPPLPYDVTIESYRYMSLCYKNGYGTPIDLDAAKYWEQRYEKTTIADK